MGRLNGAAASALNTRVDVENEIQRGATLSEQVYANLAQRLLTGAWAPATRLSVRLLADDLSVGITPVRDAMNRLTTEGALENVDGRGFRTVALNRADYQEIVRMRLALEPVAATLAASMINGAAVDALEKQNDKLAAAIEAGELAIALQIDTNFHLAIYEHAGQPLLLSTIASLLLRAGPTRTRLSGSYRRTMTGVIHHRKVLDALRNLDADEAAAEIVADLRDGSNAILSEMQL